MSIELAIISAIWIPPRPAIIILSLFSFTIPFAKIFLISFSFPNSLVSSIDFSREFFEISVAIMSLEILFSHKKLGTYPWSVPTSITEAPKSTSSAILLSLFDNFIILNNPLISLT